VMRSRHQFIKQPSRVQRTGLLDLLHK
jgi:hypothetical protein